MSSILNSPDVLAAIRQRKSIIQKKLKASRLQIVETANSLTGPIPKATSRAQSISRLVVNGLVIYKGLRFCTDILSSLRSIFTPRKRGRR